MTGRVNGTIRDKVLRLSMPEPMSGCWLWLGNINHGGYGRFRGERAHRVAYEAFVGPVPDGMVVDHKCFNRCCVNPDHLQVMSRGDNARRLSPQGKATKDALFARRRQVECIHGHGREAYRDLGNRRYCATCSSIRYASKVTPRG